MSNEFRIQAINPRTGDIETARLIEDHFGTQKHSIRFVSDGLNAPHYASWLIPWEPMALTRIDAHFQKDGK